VLGASGRASNNDVTTLKSRPTDAKPKVFNAFKRMPGHDKREHVVSARPHEYIDATKLPKSFTWSDVEGVNYLTKMLNQHVPQYCGSCWAHGAMSSLADRIKIAKGPHAKGPDVNLAIQFILNCGTEVAGSCHGGSATGAYQFVKEAGFVPFETCLVYEACSAESSEGSCAAGDVSRYECKPENTCRTCSTFSDMGGFCSALDSFPNASVAEYGEVSGEKEIMAEVYARGPVAAGIDANLLDEYTGGILDQPADYEYEINHIVAIVGWGETKKGEKYWIVRNSWGEYWGEMGFFRIVRGKKALGIEDECSWATPASWTTHNQGCYEDGSNCVAAAAYVDPATAGARPFGEILGAGAKP
jgi:cathepsin X